MYAVVMTVGPEAATAASIKAAVVVTTREFPEFSVASAAMVVLGGAAAENWDKLYIAIFSSVSYSCVLGFLKQDSRSTHSSSSRRRTMRAYISLVEQTWFPLSTGSLYEQISIT